MLTTTISARQGGCHASGGGVSAVQTRGWPAGQSIVADRIRRLSDDHEAAPPDSRVCRQIRIAPRTMSRSANPCFHLIEPMLIIVLSIWAIAVSILS